MSLEERIEAIRNGLCQFFEPLKEEICEEDWTQPIVDLYVHYEEKERKLTAKKYVVHIVGPYPFHLCCTGISFDDVLTKAEEAVREIIEGNKR